MRRNPPVPAIWNAEAGYEKDCIPRENECNVTLVTAGSCSAHFGQRPRGIRAADWPEPAAVDDHAGYRFVRSTSEHFLLVMKWEAARFENEGCWQYTRPEEVLTHDGPRRLRRSINAN